MDDVESVNLMTDPENSDQPTPVASAPKRWWRRFRSFPKAVQVGVWIFVALLVLGALAPAEDEEAADGMSAEATSAKSDEPVTTEAPEITTTSAAPTTTSVAPTTAPPTTTSTIALPTTSVAPSPPPATNANPFGGDSPEDFLMPDLVCKVLQDAQNEIQDHGTFFSRSTDASGGGRSQLIDSNWIVVAQDPLPGTPIGEGEANLFVLKLDEPHGC
jgi:hypothetical protein